MANISEKFAKYVNECTISNDLIYIAAEYFIRKNQLDNYVKDIKICNSKEQCADTTACYNLNTRIIKIAPNVIYQEFMDSIPEYKVNPQNTLKYYYYLLRSLYHELTHSKQLQIVSEFDNLISNLLTESFYGFNNYKPIYEENHDTFPAEYNARLQAEISFYNLMIASGFFTNGAFDINDYNKNILAIILLNYKNYEGQIVSPIEQYNSLIPLELYKEYKENDCENYIKLLYGLPIDKKSYNKILLSYITNNNIENVKTYLKCI